MLNGIKFRRAIHELEIPTIIRVMKRKGFAICFANARNEADIAMLVTGPARAVFPIFSRSISPSIITIPGAMNLIGESIESKVIRLPMRLSRNSAHKP